MFKLVIEVEGLPKILSNAKSNGWRARHFEKQKWKKLIMEQIDFKKKPAKPLQKCIIICTRFSSSQSDYGNRVDSFKACIDALIASGVIIDDNDQVIIKQQYPWVKVPMKSGKIRIEVEEIS